MAGSMCGRHGRPSRICNAFMNKSLICGFMLGRISNIKRVQTDQMEMEIEGSGTLSYHAHLPAK